MRELIFNFGTCFFLVALALMFAIISNLFGLVEVTNIDEVFFGIGGIYLTFAAGLFFCGLMLMGMAEIIDLLRKLNKGGTG